MIWVSIVVLGLLGAVLGSPFRYSEHDYGRYRGPPAPLNPDGTVAFTPEYQHIRDEHRAVFDREYHRIKNGNYAAETYSNPNPLKSYVREEDQGHHLPEIHEEGDSPTSEADEGHYHPELYETPYSSLYDDGQYRPHLYQRDQEDENQSNSPPYSQGTSYRPSYAPAPLNPGGTVAKTQDYNAIASSYLANYQALSRHRRSTERYQGPPAPLNQDFTVDYTPEVKHFNDAHFSAVANQFKRLQATAALAAAHPDRTSPPSKDYNPQNNGHHSLFVPHPNDEGLHFERKKRSYNGQYTPQYSRNRNYDDGQYRPHHHGHAEGQYNPQLHQVVDYNTEPHRPAPLHADGTVAHVPEYLAIAASHRAAHHAVLSTHSH